MVEELQVPAKVYERGQHKRIHTSQRHTRNKVGALASESEGSTHTHTRSQTMRGRTKDLTPDHLTKVEYTNHAYLNTLNPKP